MFTTRSPTRELSFCPRLESSSSCQFDGWKTRSTVPDFSSCLTLHFTSERLSWYSILLEHYTQLCTPADEMKDLEERSFVYVPSRLTYVIIRGIWHFVSCLIYASFIGSEALEKRIAFYALLYCGFRALICSWSPMIQGHSQISFWRLQVDTFLLSRLSVQPNIRWLKSIHSFDRTRRRKPQSHGLRILITITLSRPFIFKMYSSILLLTIAALASAKTDIAGCVTSKTTNQYGEASVLWYVPTSGEICEILDCGGGRAPPKTTVPGCGSYEGTETYSPQFLSGFNAQETGSSQASESASVPSSTMTITSAASTSTAIAIDSTIISSSTSEALFTIQTSIPPADSVTSTGILVAPTPAVGSTMASMPSLSVGNTTATTSSPATTSSLVANNAGASISVKGMSGLMGFAAAGFAFLM